MSIKFFCLIVLLCHLSNVVLQAGPSGNTYQNTNTKLSWSSLSPNEKNKRIEAFLGHHYVFYTGISDKVIQKGNPDKKADMDIRNEHQNEQPHEDN